MLLIVFVDGSCFPNEGKRSGYAGVVAYPDATDRRNYSTIIYLTEDTDAIAFASSSSITCSISGARMPASIAGWAETNINASRRSGDLWLIYGTSRPSLITSNCSAAIPHSALATENRLLFAGIIVTNTTSNHANFSSFATFAGDPVARPVAAKLPSD